MSACSLRLREDLILSSYGTYSWIIMGVEDTVCFESLINCAR